MSNLYMTTEEFAAMIVDTLDEQNYFKKGSKNHPGDIVAAFTTTAETIGTVMEWAIKRESNVNKKLKQAIMNTGNLSKNISGSWATASYSSEHVPSIDDEIAPDFLEKGQPLITEEDSLGYSEWKKDGYL